jgi:hypothetical protein
MLVEAEVVVEVAASQVELLSDEKLLQFVFCNGPCGLKPLWR